MSLQMDNNRLNFLLSYLKSKGRNTENVFHVASYVFKQGDDMFYVLTEKEKNSLTLTENMFVEAFGNNGNYIVSFNNSSSITANNSGTATKAFSIDTKSPNAGTEASSTELVHYSGRLGEFDYDPKLFKVSYYSDGVEYLKYIGKLSSVRIPYGIKSCYRMFKDCTYLKEAPIIPDSVTDCSYMFFDCTYLEEAPVIPKSVRNCKYMFAGCKLKEAPIIPDSVTDCSYMFFDCVALRKAPIISNSVTDCSRMFYYCESLKEAPIIPDSVINCQRMFWGCKSLEEAPIIPNSVTDCLEMFQNCESLKKAPTIPNSVKDCRGMFKGCKSLKKVPVIPTSVKYCESMFEYCVEGIIQAGEWNIAHRGKSYYGDESEIASYNSNALELGSFKYNTDDFDIETIRGKEYLIYCGNETDGRKIKIPDGITCCSYMFEGNKTLEYAPTIPHSITRCVNMFKGCTSLKETPDLSKTGIIVANGMFMNCTSLTKINGLPERIAYCNSMFEDCKALTDFSGFNNWSDYRFSVDYEYGENYKTYGFKDTMEQSRGITCKNMFKNCISLIKTGNLIEGVSDCSYMFEGCKSLSTVFKKLPKSVYDVSGMFKNCVSLTTVPLFYMDLEHGPYVPKMSEHIFKGCTDNICILWDTKLRDAKLKLEQCKSLLQEFL